MSPSWHDEFALGLLIGIFAIWAVSFASFRKRPRDLSRVRGSALLGSTIRGWHDENLHPFEELLVRRRVSASFLSYLQLGVAVLIGIAYAEGLIFVAGWLVITAGSLDILDGRVARRTDGGSRQGAFLDSVIDRYVDALGLLGLAAFYANSWMLWVVLFSLVGGLMVSYTRARAEGLGARCEIGLLQRPERYVLLGLGSIFGSLVQHMTGWRLWGQPYGLLVVTLVLLAVLSNATAIQRARHVMRVLREAPREASNA